MTAPGASCPPPADDVSIVVVRAAGTVLVTVDGRLGPSGAELLDGMLTDLIEGQGNLAVAVDLAKAVVDPERHTLFVVAARRARRRGGAFILRDPPAELVSAVQSSEAGDLVEVLAGRSRPSEL